MATFANLTFTYVADNFTGYISRMEATRTGHDHRAGKVLKDFLSGQSFTTKSSVNIKFILFICIGDGNRKTHEGVEKE